MMQCKKCGHIKNERGSFCPQCGAKYNKEGSKWWLLSAGSLLIVCAGLSGVYLYEAKQNEKAKQMREEAEELALEGKYERAASLLKNVLEMRPAYAKAKENRKDAALANMYVTELKRVSMLLKSNRLEEAEEALQSIQAQASKLEGEYFIPLQEEIKKKSQKLTVAKILSELNELNTVGLLADKLSILSTLPADEAKELREQILNRIVNVAIQKAEKDLQQKHFNAAEDQVQYALEYAINNEKLMSFQERIQQEKAAFEQVEEQRLEEALEAAAQEDLHNRTKAVEAGEIKTALNEYGELTVSGTVKNIATQNIYNVNITFQLFDTAGNLISTYTTAVNPYYLEPEGIGQFEYTIYGMYSNARAKVENITWYLE